MDYLARKFLEGRYLGWKDMRKLYGRYKRYCRVIGVGVLDLSVVDEEIEWEMAFATGSIILNNGSKPEWSNAELFSTATLIGEMEFWFYQLRERNKVLSDVWLLSVMNHEKSIDVAEKIGILTPGDGPDKIYYVEHSRIPHMIRSAARKITRIRERILTNGRLCAKI